MLEATLLFGGMGLHDQHSDLRLDVDNMSYEVLYLWNPVFSVSLADIWCTAEGFDCRILHMATYFSAAAGLQLSGWFWMMMWCNYQSWCCAVLDTNLKITGWRTSFLNHLIDTGSPDQVVLNSHSLWLVGFVAKVVGSSVCEHRSCLLWRRE